MALIYSGAVEVQLSEMRAFVLAAKFLKLQGFENIKPTVSTDDIRDRTGRYHQPRRGYSIRLKRIDDPELAMDLANGVINGNGERSDSTTATTNQPMANGDNSNDGSNRGHDHSNQSGNCNGNANPNADGDDGASNGVRSIVDGRTENKIVENGISNSFQLSSSSDSEVDNFESASESELSGETLQF